LRPQSTSRVSHSVAGKKKLKMIQFKGFDFDFQTVNFKKLIFLRAVFLRTFSKVPQDAKETHPYKKA